MDGSGRRSGSVKCAVSAVVLVDLGSKTFIRLVLGPLLPKQMSVLICDVLIFCSSPRPLFSYIVFMEIYSLSYSLIIF
jgi:hypothetical protein